MEWEMVDDDGVIKFDNVAGGGGRRGKVEDIPSMNLVAQNLGYVTELERIV